MAGLAGASPATADAHRVDLGCNNTDAPVPAPPGGAGGFAARPGDAPAQAATPAPGEIDPAKDPFENPDEVSLESVYGPIPQWWTYDNGCTGQFVAGAGTALANIEMEISGLLPSWSHALLRTVVDPDSQVKELNEPVIDATRAVSEGVWSPWLPIAILLVAMLVLLRARQGHLAGSVTATTWALAVLVASSWIIQYPMEAVRLVDDGVSGATRMIATSFDANDSHAEAKAGTDAIDLRMDDVMRATQYRTWLTGAFGDPESATAREHGPELYRATHFSWDEWQAYKGDPDGIGKEIVEAKQDSFKQIAEQVHDNDPHAYVYFQGGKWSQRASSAFVNLLVAVVVCGYLLIAGLAALLALVLIRMIVPFAPVMGVLFMVDSTRDAAVGMLKPIVGPLVMGPICFLVALVLLRFDTAILSSNAWFPIKIALICGLAAVAWSVTRPATYGLPGSGRMVRLLADRIGSAVGQRRGFQAGVTDGALRAHAGTSATSRRASETSPGGVYMYLPGFAGTTQTGMSPEAEALPSAISSGHRAQATSEAGTASPSGASALVPPPGSLSLKRIRERWPAPPVMRRVAVGPLGPRTNFPPRGFSVEPHTAYEVDGRGTFYADGESKVRHIETEYYPSGQLNWDLNWPLPDATFVVSGIHVFITDHDSRTVEANDPHIALRNAPRSPKVQTAVGDIGGPEYDGGHWLQNAAGGGPERINVGPMLALLNRAVSDGSPEKLTDNYYDLETYLRNKVKELADDGATKHDVGLKVIPVYEGDSRVPTRIRAQFLIDGELEEEEFENVRHDADGFGA